MEMTLNKGFEVLDPQEMMEVDGGSFVAGLAIGIVVGWVVDGALKATTGKSGSDWVASGIEKINVSHPPVSPGY